MAGITVQSFLSAAAGIAVAIALIRGFARRSAATIGNFWVDLTRATLYMLLPICVVAPAVPGLAGRAADARTPTRRHHPGGRARSSWRAGRSPRRKRSSCCAATAAASSTPTRRIRSRIRPRSAGLIEMLLIFLLGTALTNTFGRMVGDAAAGLGAVRGDGGDVPGRRRRQSTRPRRRPIRPSPRST